MEFTVNVTVSGHVATLEWNGPATPELLLQAVSMATDDALIARELHRVEVSLPVGDEMARNAVQNAGFRLDGVRRGALQVREGEFADVVIYSRLASDVVYGEVGTSAVTDTVTPKKRVAALGLIRHDSQVLVLPNTLWALPGAVVADGETPREVVARSCRTDLQLFVTPKTLVSVDWVPPTGGWSDTIVFVFDCGELAEDEVAALRSSGVVFNWTDDFASHPRLARHRITAALTATADQVTAYLENGNHVG